MRITAGKYRGRRIKCPPGVIRPAMDRMRESMFSILGNIEGLSFLDCFSGSGLVGIEAASRGAGPVHLVEMDRGKKSVMLQNLSFVEEQHRLFMMPVQKYLKMKNRTFDLIYLDPPFPMEDKQKLVELADSMEALVPGGMLLIHYPGEEKWPDRIGSLEVVDHRKYGRSELLFFKNCRQ